MEQETQQVVQDVTYFVIFKRQSGETEPAYSYVDKEGMEQATKLNIIDKAYVVSATKTHTPEETLTHIKNYKNETGWRAII